MAREVVGDFEADRLAQQLAFANALRDQGLQGNGGQGMHGRVYMVGNQLGNIAKMLGGAYMANQAQQGQQELEQKRDAELQQFLAARPKAYAETPTPELNDQGAPVMAQTPKPFQQQIQENADWQAGGMALHHPLARAMAVHGLQNATELPMKLAEMELRQKEIAQQKEADRFFKEQMQRDLFAQQNSRDQFRADHPTPQFAVVQEVRPDGTIGPRVISKAQVGPTDVISPETAGERSARDKATKAYDEKQQAISKFDDVVTPLIGNLNELFPKGKINPDLDAYVGKYNTKVPDVLLSDPTLTAGKKFESLRSQQLVQNLSDARKFVGQSFGSITEREWDKFQNLMGNMERGNTREGLESTATQINDWLVRHRASLEKLAKEATPPPARPSALPGATGRGNVDLPNPAPSGAARISSDADYDNLPSGSRFIGPDGIERRKP